MNALPQHVRVCIVGGGVAGLGAAHQLLQSGQRDILLLEAQNRVGGRVCTVRHGKNFIELGAHWIHGEDGNVVYEWASESGLVSDEASVVQTGEQCCGVAPQRPGGGRTLSCARLAPRVQWDSGCGNTAFIRQDGKVVPEAVVDGFLMVATNILENSEEDLKTYTKSLGDFCVEKFKELNTWGNVGDELLAWEGRFQNCINGSDSWHDVSGMGLTAYKECPGNPTVNWKQDGYQNLIDHLQEKIPSSHMLLNCPVKCVEWGLAIAAAPSGCRVTLESGHVITANHIIFTPSLGFLKVHAKNLFSPPLPMQKMKAIEGLGFGVVGKIFLQFPHQWWDDECDGFSILPNLQEVPAEITKENWECGLLGFYAVYKQRDMLCGWMTGPTALVIEQTSEAEVGWRCVALLRKLLSPRLTVPDVVWCKRTTWGQNPWIRGGYSFRSMKSESMGVWAADLAQPLLDSKNTPVVCFAGEATHDCYYSTVHGALESGRREATRLLHHINSVVMKEPVKVREKYKVVVVGCGAAGVGAARELRHHGITSVIILEGNDRVGGRIKTVEMHPSGGIVELGAQWVHIQDGNDVYTFAATQGLLHHQLSPDGKGNFFIEGGKSISEDVVKQVREVMNEADKECSGYCDSRKHEGIDKLSVGNVFRKKFVEYLQGSQADSQETRKLKEALYHWNLRWQRIDNACDSLHQLSAKCWGHFIAFDNNDNANPHAGYISIFRALLEEISVEVKLNSEVICIDYAQEVSSTESGSYVRPDGTTYPVIVKCIDGSEYEAQHVIMTSSIGFLKTHPTLFSPPLPEKLYQSISSRGYGTIDKIFLEYKERWWWESCQGIQLVWTEGISDLEQQAPHTQYVDNTFGKMRDYWVRGVSGFDPVFQQSAVLCGWVGGAEAEYMEGLSEQQVGRDCTLLLRHFLPHIDIPYPKKVYRSRWSSDKFFHGSYSYHSVGCECCSGASPTELNAPINALSHQGIQVPVVVLAGEANSKKYYSTVHGAFQNGMEQAAHYINSHYKLRGSANNIKSKI